MILFHGSEKIDFTYGKTRTQYHNKISMISKKYWKEIANHF